MPTDLYPSCHEEEQLHSAAPADLHARRHEVEQLPAATLADLHPSRAKEEQQLPLPRPPLGLRRRLLVWADPLVL